MLLLFSEEKGNFKELLEWPAVFPLIIDYEISLRQLLSRVKPLKRGKMNLGHGVDKATAIGVQK